MERIIALIFMNSKKGFTLIEILVVIFIVGLLSAVVFSNFRQGEKEYSLNANAQGLISELRKAQSMAMSGAGVSSGSYYGYGIHFSEDSANSYILFGDKDNDRRYDSDELIKTITLSPLIRIKELTASPLDVFFESPDPTTYFNANSSPGVSVDIVLEIEGASKTKSVHINTSGLIYTD